MISRWGRIIVVYWLIAVLGPFVGTVRVLADCEPLREMLYLIMDGELTLHDGELRFPVKFSGKWINDVEIGEKIGRGNSADVYRGKVRSEHGIITVAVKRPRFNHTAELEKKGFENYQKIAKEIRKKFGRPPKYIGEMYAFVEDKGLVIEELGQSLMHELSDHVLISPDTFNSPGHGSQVMGKIGEVVRSLGGGSHRVVSGWNRR